nr:hypothetical protein [Streptococcus pneumoniae]
MQELTKKQKLKKQELKPKIKLRKERKKHELTTVFMADLIGLKNRRQYELKENGKAPFHDYEISIISNYFHKSESELFFKIKYLNLRFKRKENL